MVGSKQWKGDSESPSISVAFTVLLPVREAVESRSGKFLPVPALGWRLRMLHRCEHFLLSARWLAASMACVALIACSSSSSSVVIVSATEGLPRYLPADAALFDDTFASEVFGMASWSPPPGLDPKIIERTQRADAVVRARVATVTRDASLGDPLYSIVMHPIESAWPAARAEDQLELRLESRNPSIPFVAQDGATLVGTVVVLFYKRYDDQGQARIHWRAEPDTRAVHEAVEHAKQLDARP